MNPVEYFDEESVHERAAPIAEGLSFAYYILWTGVITAGACLLVMIFVGTVDPYRLFGMPDIEGFNRTKPVPGQYREQIKLAQAKALRPNTFLLGNSRIEVGFDPESPQLGKHGHATYNLALAGTDLTVAQRMVENLRSEAVSPSMAIIGVEFLDFLVKPPAAAGAPAMHDGWLSPLQWRFDTVFSMTALSEALRTVRLQSAPYPETMTRRGQTPLHEYNLHARREGYYSLFQQRAQENALSLVRKRPTLYDVHGRSESIESLRKVLRSMAADGAEVHLVIYPYHAQLMAMFDEAGLQSVLEEWKYLLVSEVEAVQRLHPAARITLWDFNGFGDVQCEPIPEPGDTRSATRFYWEAGHFKSSVGELIQKRVLGGASAFGVPLTMSNLEQNRQRIAAERANCAAEHAGMFAAARTLIGAARASSR